MSGASFVLGLAGGGTGGHLVPGLHLLRWLERIGAVPSRCVWFTAGRPIEDRVFAGFEGVPIERVALALEPPGGGAPSLSRTALRAAPETLRARRALAGVDVLVGLGGYTSLPPILAAKSRGIPIVLLEINATPGRATRALGRFAHTIVHAWGATLPASDDPRHRLFGPPLDPRLSEPCDRAAARVSLGASSRRPLLLVLGGSQGALGLNRFVAEHARPLVEGGLSVVHQVGPGRLDEAFQDVLEHYRAVEYVDDVPAALAAAELVLARGGASTLAEIAARRVPAIVVPYPHHADRHQEHNARMLGEGVRIVPESELGPATVVELLRLAGPEGESDRARARDALGLAVDPRAGERLAQLVVELARSR